jgi:hypothetical protein
MPEVSVGRFAYDVSADSWEFSEHLHRMLGIRPGTEITTYQVLSHVHEDDREAATRRVKELGAADGPLSGHLRATATDGRARRLAYVGETVSEDDGTGTRFSGYLIDLTELVRSAADEAVGASTEHRAAIEQAKGALMLAYGITDDVAFRLLCGISQNHNVKVRDVAAELTDRMASSRYQDLGPKATLLSILADLDTEKSPQGT